MKRLLADRSGVTAVEFGFVAGPLFVLIFGIVKVGQVMWVENALNYSVQEAARCGAVNKSICATPGQTESYAASAAGAGITAAAFTASTQSCGSDVLVSYTMTLSAPFLSYSVPLTAHACFPQ